MSNHSISTYEIVNLQIQALNSLLASALSEEGLDDNFKLEIQKINATLEDYLSRQSQAN